MAHFLFKEAAVFRHPFQEGVVFIPEVKLTADRMPVILDGKTAKMEGFCYFEGCLLFPDKLQDA